MSTFEHLRKAVANAKLGLEILTFALHILNLSANHNDPFYTDPF